MSERYANFRPEDFDDVAEIVSVSSITIDFVDAEIVSFASTASFRGMVYSCSFMRIPPAANPDYGTNFLYIIKEGRGKSKKKQGQTRIIHGHGNDRKV